MSDDPFQNIVSFPDAGKEKFDELLYARKFLRRVKLRTHKKEWHVYNGKCWEMRDSAAYESLAMAVIPDRLRKAKSARSVMEHVSMIQQLAPDEKFVGAVQFDDRGRVLINCDNGVLSVGASDVKLRPHDEKMLFAGCLRAGWPGKMYERSDTELFSRTLDEVLPDSRDQALIQWYAGYLLYPALLHEVFLISHGGSGSGKSTMSDSVMDVIGGKPLRTVLSMAQICAEGQGAYSLPSLQHAIVNMGTDLDTVDITDSANFKRIVSGEPIEVRPIYDEPYTMSDALAAKAATEKTKADKAAAAAKVLQDEADAAAAAATTGTEKKAAKQAKADATKAAAAAKVLQDKAKADAKEAAAAAAKPGPGKVIKMPTGKPTGTQLGEELDKLFLLVAKADVKDQVAFFVGPFTAAYQLLGDSLKKHLKKSA